MSLRLDLMAEKAMEREERNIEMILNDPEELVCAINYAPLDDQLRLYASIGRLVIFDTTPVDQDKLADVVSEIGENIQEMTTTLREIIRNWLRRSENG